MEAHRLPGPLRLSPAFPFAGRARELATLAALLPRAAEEGRRAALVSGEAGSGKSRLVRELAVRLSPEGAVVMFGACDAVFTTPYGPFVEALQGLVRDTDPTLLRDALGSGGGELTRLLPDLEAVVGPLPAPVAAEADTERHRLHTAVTDLLTAVSASSPVLLVLEDVHWADSPTIQLIRHLTRFGAPARLLLVVTFRDVEVDVPAELAESIADAARLEGVTRVRLTALDERELTEFVHLATGAEPDRVVIEAIARLTAGNAFLLTELWRELVETDAVEVGLQAVTLRRPIDDVATPETVREVVTQRIGRLDAVTVDILELAAVAGASFELDTVRRAAAVDEAALLDAVDEAVRSGLLLEAPGYGLGYRFAHELVRRAVLDRVSAPRRAELHLRVAHALESTEATGGERGRLAALAFHYAEAAPLGDRDVAVTYNLLAAAAAADALAFDEAAGRLRTALDLGVVDDRRRAEAALDLGASCHRAGHATDALDAFRDAAAIGRELGDVELLARAAIGFEEASWRPAILDQGAVALLEEAVLAIGPAPSELRVRLLAALTRALDFLGDHERARPVRDEATILARSLGDPVALALLLASAFWSRGARSDEEINRLLTEALAIGEEVGDLVICAEALSWLVPSHVALCDHASARAVLRRLFDLAGRTNEPFRLHVAEHYSAALALCDGDLVGAEAAATRSNDWSRLLRGRDASGVHGIQMFGIRREQGRLAELAPVIRMLAAESRATAWVPGLAVVLADLGMDDEARRELRRIRPDELDPASLVLWLAGLTYLTDAACKVDDVDMAELLYPKLAPYRGTNVQVGHLVACYGSADRFLGMLATVLGELDVAEGHFEAALALNQRLGARTWLAHTQVELARMLLLRGTADDRARASALLGQAVAAARELGLGAVLQRVRAIGEIAEPMPTLPDGLTAREVEILRLVAQGRSNREVGQQLVISEHTAANHVRSILRKTGCANRTEAATYAHQRGLSTSEHRE